MDFITPDHEQAELICRAIKTVITCERPMTAAQLELWTTVQSQLFGEAISVDSVEPITPEAFAEALPDAGLRDQAISAMIVHRLVCGSSTPGESACLNKYASACGVTQQLVQNLETFSKGETLRMRLDFMRNSHIAQSLKQNVHKDGILETLAEIGVSMGRLNENKALSSRYEALEKLPKHTVGNHLWQFYIDSGFSFPGQNGSLPEFMIYHDMTHILSGYGTTPEGEIQVGGFTGGYKKHQGLHVIFFVLMAFNSGLVMVPTGGKGGLRGRMNSKDMPGLFAKALARGSKMTVDLSDGWDWWSVMDRPIDEIREEYNIPPLT